MDLKVTAGSPTDTELAVVCAVLSVPPAQTDPVVRPRRGPWSHPSRQLGVSRNWRDSTLPPLTARIAFP